TPCRVLRRRQRIPNRGNEKLHEPDKLATRSQTRIWDFGFPSGFGIRISDFLCMELTRRSVLVYGLLTAVWLLVLGWQIEEHHRVKEAAKTDLRNRSKDIAKTVSAFIRGLRSRGG